MFFGALGSELQRLASPSHGLGIYLLTSFCANAAVIFAVLRVAPLLARALVGAAQTVPLSKEEVEKMARYAEMEEEEERKRKGDVRSSGKAKSTKKNK